MRRDESKTTTPDGLMLFQQSWHAGQPKAHIVVVHGLGEHSTRYEHVAERFTDAGYDVHAFDLRGHGRSEGERTWIGSIDEYIGDVERFVDSVRSRANGQPMFILGHSMGGAITARYLVDADRGLTGAILSAPAVRRAGIFGRPLEAIFLWVAKRWPRLRSMTISGDRVSRDPEVQRRYDADPLIHHEGTPLSTLAAVVHSARHVDEHAGQIKLPVLFAHGTKDKLVNPDASRRLHGRVDSKDPTLKLYEGLYHEILNEPEREQVMTDMLTWLDEQVAS